MPPWWPGGPVLSGQHYSLSRRADPGVAMGSYLQVLFVLGLEKDMQKVAADDLLGRKLQDAGLLRKK